MNGLLVFIEIEQLEVYHTFVIFDDYPDFQKKSRGV